MLIAGGIAAVLFLIASAAMPSGHDASSSARSEPASRSAPPDPAPLPSPSVAFAPSDVRSYAVALDELQGLPSDAPPGTQLELYVAWDPPITKRPRIQLLMGDVTLDKIVPPLTPNGVPTALLLIKEDRIGAVLFADRYGALSAAVVPYGS